MLLRLLRIEGLDGWKAALPIGRLCVSCYRSFMFALFARLAFGLCARLST